MNKKLLLTLALGFVASVTWAQEAPFKHKKMRWELDSAWRSKTHHEIGVNISEFVKTFIVPNNNTNLGANATTYLLTYKTIFKGGPTIRLGLGGQLSKKQIDDDDFSGIQTQINNQFNGRLGFEWQFNLGRKWNCYAGVDAIYSSGKSRVETPDFPPDVTVVETKSSTFGGGPVAGIQFRISKRLSLLTETALYVKSVKTTDSQTSSSFSSKSITKETAINFIAPQSLFFVITF